MTVGLKIRKFDGKPDPWEPGIGNDEMLRRYVARYGVEPGFPARDPKTGEFRPLPGGFGFDPSRDRLSGAENTGFDKISLELAYKDGYSIPSTIGSGLGGPDTDGRASTTEVVDLQFCGDLDWFTEFTGKYRKQFPAAGETTPSPTVPPPTRPTVPHPTGPGEPAPEPPKPEPPKPLPPPSVDPLAPFFSWVREWPRGLGQRAAARQFLDWVSPRVSGSPADVLAYLDSAIASWPDGRKDAVKAFLAFAREKVGGSPAPTPTPVPVPTPPVSEGLTLYRKDGEVWNSTSSLRGKVEVPIPRTLRLKKLQVEMDFMRGPQPTNKDAGPDGPRNSLALLLWVRAKGTLRPWNQIATLNVAKDFLKLQSKVDIERGSGFEGDKLSAILAPGSHHLSFVYDAGDAGRVTIGPHTFSVKSTARNGVLEIPKGNLSIEFGHDPSVDGNPGTPEATSPPGWSVSNLVVTGIG